ncbi:hypothetical protein [Propionivibrio sp.]|uniref:hypothetical protein n=1 Tax=Propionivibrio sp. TaxID=2212460 RepID=UPI003BF1B0E0
MEPNVEIELRNSISATEIERKFLVQKAENYELLRKRFPNKGLAALSQVVDPKDAGAKFLPLDTQLIAINTEIYAVDESLTRLRHKLKQQASVRDFLKKAIPSLAEHTDGVDLGNYLLEIIIQLHKEIDLTDSIQQQSLNSLESDIKSILTRFNKGLQVSVAPHVVSSTSRYKILGALGFFGGGMVMLIFILARRSLTRIRKMAE